jgi:hypothetical protein
MKSSILMIIIGMMIISFYSYSLPEGYAIQQQSATTAQPPSSLPPQTSGGQEQSATEDLIVATVGDSKV